MKCIWQLEGDKVKGFKCEFSPVDMLIVVSGLKYITADIERHPKDRDRAQYIYNKIMLSRYEDELQGDDIIVRSNVYPFRVVEADRKTENSSENPNNCEDEDIFEYCPRCGMRVLVDKDINVRSKDEHRRKGASDDNI